MEDAIKGTKAKFVQYWTARGLRARSMYCHNMSLSVKVIANARYLIILVSSIDNTRH